MKRISIWATALLGIFAISSCSTDRDSNPVLTVPQSFELLVPEIGDNVINLENSESIQFKAKAAPNYGFPTETSYWVEISEDQAFADATKLSATDTKGKSITYDAPANEIDLGIMKIRGIEEDSPEIDWGEVITLYVRMVACPSNAKDSANYVYSNVQSIKVTSYFLKEALPELWYMTGDCVGNASWTNASSAIGAGLLPLCVKKGETYNRFTGKGIFEYIGYFFNGPYGFKILAPKGLDEGGWNYDIGGKVGADMSITDGSGYCSRAGGADVGNITVSEGQQGYYKLTLDTNDEDAEELKIDAYEPDDPVVNYTSMSFGEKELSPMTTIVGAYNHDWYGVITLAAPAKIKFTANDGTEWGTDAFPYGLGTDDGEPVPVEAGTYTIYFNDITGAYMFTEQKD